MPNKVLVILIDGVGDHSLKELGDKTPLQYALTPNMDQLGATSLLGLMDPCEPGFACGSDTAHLSLLGYSPFKYYRGRGAFEAMGAGVEMQPGDIAFKSNFATIDPETRTILSRRADRHFEAHGPMLCSYLQKEIPHLNDSRYKVSFQYATEHRCAIKLSGPGITDAITGTDPLKDNLPLLECKPTDNSESGLLTSKLVNELSEKIEYYLTAHPLNIERALQHKSPVNCILLRGAGERINIPAFNEKYNLKSFMIAPTCIISGLGKTVDMDIIKVEGATGDYFTNIMKKGIAAVNCLKMDYTFGFIHIKAVDDAGHDRDIEKKIYFLEKVDEMVGYVAEHLNDHSKKTGTKVSICITGDHSTPVSTGDHSFEPVPFLLCPDIANSGIDKCISGLTFDEISCAEGVLGRFYGGDMMKLIKWSMKQI